MKRTTVFSARPSSLSSRSTYRINVFPQTIVTHPSYLLVSKANTGIVGSADLKGLGVMESYLKEIAHVHILSFI